MAPPKILQVIQEPPPPGISNIETTDQSSKEIDVAWDAFIRRKDEVIFFYNKDALKVEKYLAKKFGF